MHKMPALDCKYTCSSGSVLRELPREVPSTDPMSTQYSPGQAPPWRTILEVITSILDRMPSYIAEQQLRLALLWLRSATAGGAAHVFRSTTP